MSTWRDLAQDIPNILWNLNQKIELTEDLENLVQDAGLNINSSAEIRQFKDLKVAVITNFQQRIAHSTVRGLTPKYTFSDTDPDKLLPLNNDDEHNLKEQLSSAIKSLSWRAFEHLCAHTMKANGVTRCEVTQGAKEQGIDLIGVVDIGEIAHSSIWHEVHIRVLGQAKFSGKSVVDAEIRLFNEDMRAFANQEGRAFKLSPDWAKSLYLAQVGFVFSLNGFTNEARKYAKSYCIALKDAEQISQDLVCSNVQTPGLMRCGSKPVFRREAFLEHFAQLR